MHPLTGTWIANIAKSRRHVNHQFASASMEFDVGDGTVVMVYEGIDASGENEKSTQTLMSDGQAHEHPLAPSIVVVNTLGDRGLESTASKGEQVLGRGSYVVSDDGRVMTATLFGVDGGGRPFEQVIVFDRATP